MRHTIPVLLLMIWPLAVPALTLSLTAARAEGPGWSATGLKVAGEVRATGVARWSLDARALEGEFNYADPSGRYAAEKLRVHGSARVERRGNDLLLQPDLHFASGQAYVEPLFADFGVEPLHVAGTAAVDLRNAVLRIGQARIEQTGIGTLAVQGSMTLDAQARGALTLEFADLQLDRAVLRYLQPFLAGTRLDDVQATGRGLGRVELRDLAPQRVDFEVVQGSVDLKKLSSALQGVDGALHWLAQGESRNSTLRWASARYGKLDLAAAEAKFRTQGRDFRLLAPLRLPTAGGALRIEHLAVERAGQADMSAAFDAELEPLDLPALCRAFGWPEFPGQLAGRVPGLRLKDRELVLDGALQARVFDGEVTVSNLRVLEPFGVLPRVTADLTLRKLDLQSMTGAFSFGRIEGRLSGEVEGLRLLGWEPVAMRARLYTPPGDRSRQRISQRAIDTISSIGGGPGSVLSKTFLRLFDDFAYARIGWGCTLANGICRMDGIGPAPKGPGYVLVEGRWLPRIDVIGYARIVNWRQFVEQLRQAREGSGPQVQ